MAKITVQNTDISVVEYNAGDYISLMGYELLLTRTSYTFTDNPQTITYELRSVTWRDEISRAFRGYMFKYDAMNRLTDAVYGESGGLSTNRDHYSERGISYTKNGALTRLLRYGKRNTGDFGLVDSLEFTLDGNKVLSVSDGAGSLVYENSFDFKSGDGEGVYEYDGCGRLVKDPDKEITFKYDLVGNPTHIITSEMSNDYIYSSAGEKLSVTAWLRPQSAQPSPFPGNSNGNELSFVPGFEPSFTTGTGSLGTFPADSIKFHYSPNLVEFCGPFIFRRGNLDKFVFEGGYCTFSGGDANFHFYRRDHLGNNRAVLSEDGTVEQITEYYPFGGVYGDVNTNPGLQPYKYNGKEFIHSYGLDLYDYGARLYDPALATWTSVDPLAEKYYDVSPYAYCGDNPVERIDIDGMDWYQDKDKTWQYSPNVHSQKDLAKGQVYKGKSFFTGKGTNLVQYRSDGSILYANETAAYNRMWNQADRHYRTSHEKEGREVGGFILNNGKVLVLPDYKNDENTFKIEEYGYITTKNGFLTRKQEKYHIKGMIHSHQSKNFGAKPSYEDYYVSKRMGGLPVITIGWDAKVHGMFASGKYYNIINWNINRKDLFSGKIKLYNYINQ